MENLQRIIAKLTILSAIFGPFLILPIQIAFVEPTFFRVFYLLLICVSIIGAFQRKLTQEPTLSNQFRIEPDGKFGVSVITFAYTWICYGLLQILWSVDEVAGLRYMYLLLSMFILVWTVNRYFNSISLMLQLFNVLLFTYTLIIAMGLWEALTGHHWFTSNLNFLVGGWAISSIFTNQNDFATYITLNMPLLTIYTFFYKGKPFKKFLLILLIIASTICLLYTASRGNILAIVLFFVLFFVYFWLLNRNSMIKRIAVMAVVVAVVAIAWANFDQVLALLPVQAAEKLNSLLMVYDPSQMIRDDASVDARNTLWQAAFNNLFNSNLMGIGPGQAEVYNANQGFSVLDVHNWWLEITVNFGVLIAIPYFLFYLYIILKNFKISRKSEGILYVFSLATAFTMLIYLVAAVSTSSAIHFSMQWIVLAIGILNIRLYERMRSS